MALEKIPDNIQIGEVYTKKIGCKYAVFIGKVNQDNLQTFLSLGIMKNGVRAFLKETLEQNPFVFILFSGDYQQIYIENTNQDMNEVQLVEFLPDFHFTPNQKKVEESVEKMRQYFEVNKMKQYQIFIDKENNEWLHLGKNGDEGVKINFSEFQHSDIKFTPFKDNTGNHAGRFYNVVVNKKREWENVNADFTNGLYRLHLSPTNRFTTSVSEWLKSEGNDKMSSEKIFICHKVNKAVFCAQDGKFVKYANEHDTRPLLEKQISVNPDLWEQINIDYPTYLILTGMKEKSKETELAEIKAKILSTEALGCQKDVMAPLVEDLLSLVHKVEGLKGYKKEATGVVIKTFTSIAQTSTFDGSETHRYEAVSGLLTNYVKKLQEK